MKIASHASGKWIMLLKEVVSSLQLWFLRNLLGVSSVWPVPPSSTHSLLKAESEGSLRLTHFTSGKGRGLSDLSLNMHTYAKQPKSALAAVRCPFFDLHLEKKPFDSNLISSSEDLCSSFCHYLCFLLLLRVVVSASLFSLFSEASLCTDDERSWMLTPLFALPWEGIITKLSIILTHNCPRAECWDTDCVCHSLLVHRWTSD